MNDQLKTSEVWDRAVDTLASMCLADKMGNGPTKDAFILTLRLYANEMEKLIQPNARAMTPEPRTFVMWLTPSGNMVRTDRALTTDGDWERITVQEVLG